MSAAVQGAAEAPAAVLAQVEEPTGGVDALEGREPLAGAAEDCRDARTPCRTPSRSPLSSSTERRRVRTGHQASTRRHLSRAQDN